MTGRALTDKTRQRAREKFLKELATNGVIAYAAKAAKMSRAWFYTQREADPEFAAAWDEALEEAVGRLEREAWRRAVDGVSEPVIGRVGKDEDGIITYVQKYSDPLMQLLLKAHRPDKYRERYEVDHKGRIEVEYVNDWRAPEGQD